MRAVYVGDTTVTTPGKGSIIGGSSSATSAASFKEAKFLGVSNSSSTYSTCKLPTDTIKFNVEEKLSHSSKFFKLRAQPGQTQQETLTASELQNRRRQRMHLQKRQDEQQKQEARKLVVKEW